MPAVRTKASFEGFWVGNIAMSVIHIGGGKFKVVHAVYDESNLLEGMEEVMAKVGELRLERIGKLDRLRQPAHDVSKSGESDPESGAIPKL